ncbi:MAG TPA: hypothetical protein VLM83_07530 [Anaerolineales bacterium]|nr:hypothetical protein [Anaerolineales bacterium]
MPIWKPDSTQIALIGSDINNNYLLFVVDTATGQTIYEGPFNADAWQVASDSPTLQWGVSFPRVMTGSSCFTFR